MSVRSVTHRIPLQLRQLRQGIVLVRASNDTVVDEYGTTITVEALMRDWLPAFLQHRTISLQHNLPELRGIRGKPFVGLARRVDFAPQLEVEVEVLDPETQALVDAGRITGASLEFVPLESRTQAVGGKESEVYYRLASEPELAGLTLTDLPAVPGAEVLEIRADILAPWQFAVVDPAVFEARSLTDAARLMWFPHHDARTHAVDEGLLERALSDLEAGRFEVPATATLSREEVARRARAHLQRHTALGIGMRTTEENMEAEQAQSQAPNQERSQQVDLNINLDFRTPAERAAGVAETPTERAAREQQPPALERWLQARTAQLEAEGTPPTQAEAQARQELEGNPELRERLESAEREPTLEERAARAAAQAVTEALSRLPEPPLAVVTDGGVSVRSRRQTTDEILSEVLARSVIPQLQRRSPTPTERQEIDNILRRNGIDTRAISVEANGTVVYNELARQFVVRPEPDIIARNHWASVPMGGTNKRTFPRFDRGGISHTWGRTSTTAITESDPTLDTFEIEVTELNSKVTVPDSFSLFNAQGPSFIQSVLLPAMRGAAQYEEDRAFFLSNGVAPNPTKILGLRYKTGVTVVASSANGDAFTQDILTSLLRAMPVRYRSDVNRLAYYLPVALGDDYGDILAARQTPGGDAWLQRFANQPGPMPIGVHRGIPIYSVPHLPTNETQGSSSNAATIYLVHRDIPVIGDALSIRIEPYRRENFINVLQLQEFVGLGYQWPDAIVRRSGVLPK
ncbi:phage major capsid protein [Meiothermus sp. PNK-Is4]|uniref:phage major capsid protein n=1 Tax=Meiothermus sp. PNK-Is4 TaxID=2740565 RepID=UPI0010219CE6|nr:phage major capsid protein [Meiothermus sp. PNK-Is4]RYM40745.1 phage major capsid protein [Meiothermus sp. PNK-Is4]